MNIRKHGFTLIELLVVIAIIALLTATIFAALTTARAKARDASRIATARSLQQALALYEDKNGSVIGINGISGGSGFSMGATSPTTTTSLITTLVNGGYLSRQVAGDSVFGTDEYYLGINPDGTYNVYSKLERPENAMTSATLLNGANGSSAVASGYNYASGFGSGVGSSGGGAVATQGGGSPSPATLSFTASPTSVVGSQTFGLTWSSTNATSSCVASGNAVWTGTKSNSGTSFNRTIAATTTFTLYCDNATAGGAGATSSVTVGYSAPPPAVSLSFSSDKAIAYGSADSFTLTWSATNASSCTASGGWGGAKSTASSQALTESATTTYTIACTNVNVNGANATSSVSVNYSASPPLSGVAYITPGTYTFTVPSGVTSVSVIAVGAGGNAVGGLGGGGGALSYANNLAVTPGSTVTVVVPAGGSGTAASFGASVRAGSPTGSTGGSVLTGTGGAGGTAPSNYTGGGAAGGYSSAGGNAGYAYSTIQTTSTSGGGSGGGSMFINNGGGGGGGGTGIYGQGSNGVIYPGYWGSGSYGNATAKGGGGSGGNDGVAGTIAPDGSGGNGGWPGGGGGGAMYLQSSASYPGAFGLGAGGAVRIIWPGNTRSFPSTSVTSQGGETNI